MAAVLTGGGAGALVLTGVLAAVHGRLHQPGDSAANLVMGAFTAGLAAAGGVSFGAARSLGVFRAAMAAMVGIALASLIGILTVPADMAVGQTGVLVLCGLSVLCTAVGLTWFIRMYESHTNV